MADASEIIPSWPKRLFAEWLSTAFLMAGVIGSGIMSDQLAGGNAALALFITSVATAAMLAVLIVSFGPVSGAHMNPAVSLVMALRGELPARLLVPYIMAQIAGAISGVMMAHLMFSMPLITLSEQVRHGPALWLSESVATFGLIGVILLCAPRKPDTVPFLVAAYIGAGYWFTASTAFANPAGSIARMITASPGGMRAIDVPAYILAELAGAALAVVVFGWLQPHQPEK